MKVLWFEVTTPSAYVSDKVPVGGWQDSLEMLVKSKCKEIELAIAFITTNKIDRLRIIDGVRYYPIYISLNPIEKLKTKWTYFIEKNKILPLAKKIVDDFSPQIIQVFGSEWCFGQIVKMTNIPVVIHMQGSIPPYHNCQFPPKYNMKDVYAVLGWNLKKRVGHYWAQKKAETRVLMEEETLRTVHNYMGRTLWDKTIVKLYNPSAKYYVCNEALRHTFLNSKTKWNAKTDRDCIKIVTVGCTSFLKGMDTVLKSAKMLSDRNFHYEWNIIGKMDQQIVIEHKECLKFSNYNVNILGYLPAEKVKEYLLDSDLYVHAAYIDNSPNSICEAQALGLPIIATYTGGIPSIIKNGINGILIPTNDPFTLSYTIMSIAHDYKRQIILSENAYKDARIRHSPDAIVEELMFCYSHIIKEEQ